jgi:polyisoprenoid-binding protein YceI
MSMRVSVIIFLLSILQGSGFSQTKNIFEPTPVNFVIKNAGLKVNGSMNGLEGFIIMDAQSTVPVKIEGTIDPNTIKTGIGLRDNHLKKADYFNVKEFPKIHMTSTLIKKSSGQKYTGNFELTIKDIKKNISIPFTFSATGDGYAMQGEFSINRLDFGLGESSVILSDSVRITLGITAKQ